MCEFECDAMKRARRGVEGRHAETPNSLSSHTQQPERPPRLDDVYAYQLHRYPCPLSSIHPLVLNLNPPELVSGQFRAPWTTVVLRLFCRPGAPDFALNGSE